MKEIPFYKMQAQGNDFIILNGLNSELPELTERFVRTITERRYGIGCDQLLVLAMLPDDQTNAILRIFNNDGSEAANCGNGLRCVADLLMREMNKSQVSIALQDRIVKADRTKNGVRIEMGAAKITDQTEAHVDVDLGNTHRVFFEATEEFPTDCNIEIVTGQIADHVFIDIIERGTGHTPACGSGACATAAAIWHIEEHNRSQTIEMPGGTVTVSGSLNNMVLEGTVNQTFEGIYSLGD
jgi:diaminopimelate epimerase